MSMKDFDIEPALQDIGADVNNLGLDDKVIIYVYEQAYCLSRFTSGANSPIYYSSSACRDETALFLTYMASLIFTTRAKSPEEHKSFSDNLFARLFMLRDFSSTPEIVDSHLKYYQEISFDSNDNLDLNSLFFELASLFLLDSELTRLKILDGSIVIPGFSEMVDIVEQISSSFINKINDLTNIIQSSKYSFTSTDIDTYMEKLRNHRAKQKEEHEKEMFKDLLSDVFDKIKNRSVILVALVLVAGILIGVAISGISKSVSEHNETLTSTIQSSYYEYPEPYSGYILSGKRYDNDSEITIHASSVSSCVVKLKTRSGTTRLSFYVRAGDTVTVGVPREYLYVYFATGETWYGPAKLFGEDTRYSKDDKICNFDNYTMEYTLYSTSNGNFSETPIDASEF